MDNLIPIGRFSRVSRLSIKALRPGAGLRPSAMALGPARASDPPGDQLEIMRCLKRYIARQPTTP